MRRWVVIFCATLILQGPRFVNAQNPSKFGNLDQATLTTAQTAITSKYSLLESPILRIHDCKIVTRKHLTGILSPQNSSSNQEQISPGDLHPIFEYLALTFSGQLYKLITTSNGTTAERVLMPTQSVQHMSALPLSPSVVFLYTDTDTYRSDDCGGSFVQLIGESRGVRELKQHPTEGNLVLASNYERCHRRERDCVRRRQLFLSTNGGKNWVLIKPFVYLYSWLKAGKYSDFDLTAIVILKQDDELIHQPEFFDGFGNTRSNSILVSSSYFKDEEIKLVDVVFASFDRDTIFAEHLDNRGQKQASLCILASKAAFHWTPLKTTMTALQNYQTRPVPKSKFNSLVVF